MHLLRSNAHAAYRAGTVLIRLMVGAVFFTEGLQKFLYPAVRGAGRFERIGFSNAEFWATFVGTFETVCGALILVGFMTRLAAVPTLVIMIVALALTKIPILTGTPVEGFNAPEASSYGFFAMTHAARTDWSMLLGSIYLIVAGSGPFSIDAILSRRPRASPRHSEDLTSPPRDLRS